MAEETQPKSEEVAVEKATVTETPPPAAEEIEPKKEAEEPEKPAEEATKDKKGGAEEELPQAVSFKEESNVVADLQDPEKKALDEFKQLIVAALSNNEFKPPPPPPPPPKEAEEPKKEEALAVVETKTEEPAAAPTAEETPKKEEEEPPKKEKEEKEPSKPEPEAPKEESSEAPPPQVAEEKAVVIEDDGTKTVEAIEETVVPVSAPPPPTTTEEVTPAEPPAAESAAEVVETPPPPPEEVFLWGIPLVGDEKSDTILLKFLRARDFKVKEALSMMKNTVIWRKAFGIEPLLEEDVGLPEMNKVVFMHGQDKEGHPVCYNVYGEFQDKDLYAKAFGDEKKRGKFLRWRIQFLEKGIRQLLDFSSGGVCTMVQVNDLKNSPGPGKRELRQTTNQALALLQDNYPEFVAKQIFINVPWWYLAYNRMISPFLTQRTKSKFVFAGPSKSAETIFKYIAPEQVPVRYGGLSKENDPDFTTTDAVTEITIKPSSKQSIEITVGESCLLVWELRVLGWHVTYGAEFVPVNEDGYTVIVQKARKLIATDDPVEKNSFKIGEPGKVVLTMENTTSKKKKFLYRYKAKSSTE